MSIPKLLIRVRSKVIPEVFNHPLWTNFVNSDRKSSPELIQHLRNLARQYETQGDILSSSEILFLCASLQKQVNKFEDAIVSLQRARSLAENHDLPNFAIFAAWGTAALHYHQGDLQSTIRALTRLQKLMNLENDWVLSDLIELIKQTLRSPEEDSGDLALALDWLKSWGRQTIIEREPPRASQHAPNAWKSKLLSGMAHLLKKITRLDESALMNLIGQQEDYRENLDLYQQHLHFQKTITRPSKDQNAVQVSEVQSPSDTARHPVKTASRDHAPSLVVYCLGQFRVYQDEELITEWPSGIGKSIFKYLITHRERPVSKDRLMELFWTNADPGSARNNLNVAIYGLRKALRAVRADFSHVLYKDDHYLINSDMAVWVDVEKFLRHIKAAQEFEKSGRTTSAITEYEAAEGLYGGDFLVEDLYEEWTMVKRRNLKESYLFLLNWLSRYYLEVKQHATCIHTCQKILVEDDCREDAHRRLMRCYFYQGQPYLALRQYHLCLETLRNELDILPTSETTDLYELIRRHNRG